MRALLARAGRAILRCLRAIRREYLQAFECPHGTPDLPECYACWRGRQW